MGGKNNPVGKVISDASGKTKGPLMDPLGAGNMISGATGGWVDPGNPLDGAVNKLGSNWFGQNNWIGTSYDANRARQADVNNKNNVAAMQNGMTFNSPLNAKGILGKNFTVHAPSNVEAEGVTAGMLNTSRLSPNTQALNALQNRALATGDSPWAKMQLENQGMEQMKLGNAAAQQAMSGGDLARSNLAMRGGLSGGAAERLAGDSSRNLNAARQGVFGQGAQDRLAIRTADDSQKTGILSQLPSMQLQNSQFKAGLEGQNIANKLGADQFNSGQNMAAQQYNAGMDWNANLANNQNSMNALNAQNNFTMQKYQNDMAAYGAGRTADAMAKQKSGKKG